MTQTSFGVFINDDWKAGARLTLSAGLRYEVFLRSARGTTSRRTSSPTAGWCNSAPAGWIACTTRTRTTFGPRAGLAWDVTGDGLTSVRSSSFGQIGSTPDVDRGNPVIGFGGPRAMQWAVKVLF